MTPQDSMKKTAEGQVSAPVLRGVTLVLGSPFSGSTLLGQCLNDIVGIAYAGELDRMHRLGFGMHIASRHHESRCEICSSHEGVACPIFGGEDESVVADGGTVGLDVYLEVLSRFGQPYVVDGSKNVDWLWHLQRKGLLQVLPTNVILAVRPVWAFVISQQRSCGGSLHAAAEGWRNIYRHALRSIATLGIPSLTVRHEDFVAHGDQWLSRAAWFVTGTPHNMHDPKPMHCIGGNVSAYAIRGDFDKQGHLNSIPEDTQAIARRKFEVFGGHGPRTDTLSRWASAISHEDACSILSIPGVMDTMLDLGYDPLRMLDEHAAWCDQNSVA